MRQTIRVVFKEGLQAVDFEAENWGSTDDNRLWIADTLGGRYYIMLNEVKWYYIGPEREEKK